MAKINPPFGFGLIVQGRLFNIQSTQNESQQSYFLSLFNFYNSNHHKQGEVTELNKQECNKRRQHIILRKNLIIKMILLSLRQFNPNTYKYYFAFLHVLIHLDLRLKLTFHPFFSDMQLLAKVQRKYQQLCHLYLLIVDTAPATKFRISSVYMTWVIISYFQSYVRLQL